jgi:hypothetical protein
MQDILVLTQMFDALQNLGRDAPDDLAQLLHPSRRRTKLQDMCASRNRVNTIDHVVEIARQQVDVLPVNRRDEGPVEAVHDFMSDLIGLMLEALDGFRTICYTLGLPGEELEQVTSSLKRA